MNNKADILGKEIRYLRKEKKLTQKQLAEGIGTQAQISRIEKGEVIPLATTLYEVAQKLGVDVNYFYNQAYIPRNDYVEEVKFQIRQLIRERNYNEVEKVINQEEGNGAFKSGINLQFILWHKGITEYYNRKNVDKSLNFLMQAYLLGKKNKIPISLQDIEILNSKAIILNEINQYEESVKYYIIALDYLKKLVYIPDKKVEIRICYGMAKSLFKLKEYKKSISSCHRGIRICIKYEKLYLLGELYYELAQNNEALSQIKEAIKNYTNAKSIFRIYNYHNFIEVVDEKINHISLNS